MIYIQKRIDDQDCILSFRENMDLKKRQRINEKALKCIILLREIMERPILPDDGINRKDFSNRSKLISEC